MANHKSAEKRARQTERRTAVNTARRSRVRGSIKKVEEAIKCHRLVEDCLVVGLPDERFGQRVVAVIGVASKNPPTMEEISEFLRPVLAHYKIPKAIVVREKVMRAPNGKADYKWARETALQG